MLLSEALIGELQKQAGLADTSIANNDVLEEECVGHVLYFF